jgi:SAM-dependent methyltransferase
MPPAVACQWPPLARLDAARRRLFSLPIVNPWLTVPASDYEGHMTAAGQLPALSAIFRGVYLEQRPRRVTVLGCATGNGFEHIDPAMTEEVIGVDINAAYLEVARKRFAASGFKLTLTTRTSCRPTSSRRASTSCMLRSCWSTRTPSC